MSVEVTGIEDVIKTLKNIDSDIQKVRVLNSAYRKASKPMVKAIKREAPRSKFDVKRYSNGKVVATYPAGHLKDNIV